MNLKKVIDQAKENFKAKCLIIKYLLSIQELPKVSKKLQNHSGLHSSIYQPYIFQI